MSELTFNLLRLGYLLLLWLFVLFAIGMLRRDLTTKASPKLADKPGRRLARRGGQGSMASAQPPRPAVAVAAAQAAAAPLAVGAPPASAGPIPTPPTPPPGSAASPVGRQVRSRPAGAAGVPASPTQLVVTAGKLVGTRIPLGQSSILIGRSPSCTLVLDDDYASSRHARVFPQGGSWYLEDLGSTNGTSINGQRVTSITPLEPGTAAQIGGSMIELRS